MNAKWTERMRAAEQAEEERTYRAIGRFMSEFSQVEYSIRYYLALEIHLKDEHFSPIIESYDVGVLTTVAKDVFSKSRRDKNKDDGNASGRRWLHEGRVIVSIGNIRAFSQSKH